MLTVRNTFPLKDIRINTDICYNKVKKGAMEMSYTPLPIGIDDFEKLITNGYYYIDKTWLVKELLKKKGEVNLFTRPRRFGKTLNLSMLKYYFEKPLDGKSRKYLFKGLRIMDAGEQYTNQMEQYPVITLTLKSSKQPTWEMAYLSMVEEIANEFERHDVILESDAIIEEDKKKFREIRGRCAKEVDYAKALSFLTKCLHAYYQKKVIILIDEYDVPLEHAYYAGFYNEMTDFIRSLFESALKSNPHLEFAVITGCLRISKESIFTGMNNLKINSILNDDYSEHFGFIEEEVREILCFYGREDKMDTMKAWYDGYCFGNTEVYNPWSVINYTEKLYSNENAFPTAAWSNTSSNSIVKDLINRADAKVRMEIEELTRGGKIEKKVHEDITYEDIYETEENLWNFLFFTGYLKCVNKRMIENDIYIELAIPNREVQTVYKNKIENWFHNEVKLKDLTLLYKAMLSGDRDGFEKELGKQLLQSISYTDNKEGFYHGFLLGLMANLKDYAVKSNREAGLGRFDLCIYNPDITIPPVIIELKVANKFRELDNVCENALRQIEEKKYDFDLAEEGYTEAICYGIGFFRKQLRVWMKRKELEGDATENEK